MLHDAAAPLYQAAAPVQPRQVANGNTFSTTSVFASSLSTSHTTVDSVTTHTHGTTPHHFSHAVYSTFTNEVDADPAPDPPQNCTAGLPAGGTIQINDTFSIVLDDSASYVAPCLNQSIFFPNSTNATVLWEKDPFYASVYPQIYTLAAATVISYILVILIFITPKTYLVGGPGSSGGSSGTTSGLRTLLPGSSARNTGVIGIGRRPLLQKIAALTVTVSLTIATADTFRDIAEQYERGYVDSEKLVQLVIGSLEVRITRVISDTFLWLAQVQTLIRLFPRHKEKVTIKWLGFGLVLCDTVFSILESFLSKAYQARPDSRADAIPALSYLFDSAISLIYASCVLYYALSKRRFAFWHARMKTVCLVALLSIVAVLIPVVFFITDLAQPGIATWGEYLRWVGGAAASVVVWEWVERIEALERDEKKDGILGREIFDGDEMLEMTPSSSVDGFGDDRIHRLGKKEKKKKQDSTFWKNVRDLHVDVRPRIPFRKRDPSVERNTTDNVVATTNSGQKRPTFLSISRPPQVASPISRSDTTSAASTVYAVRYHDPFSPSPAIPEHPAVDDRRVSDPPNLPPAISDGTTLTNSTTTTMDQRKPAVKDPAHAASNGSHLWQGVSNPFKRKRTEPPAEVAAQIAESNSRRSPMYGRSKLKTTFNTFATTQKAKLGGRSRKNRTPLGVTFIPSQPRAHRAGIDADNHDSDSADGSPGAAVVAAESARVHDEPASGSNLLNAESLPVTVIPAPIRGGRTWSPDDMDHTEEPTPSSQEQQHPQSTPLSHPSEQSTDLRHNAGPSPSVIHSQRGTLTISESPGRLRDAGTPVSRASSAMRRARNNRSMTMTSISDRLGSTSPTGLSRSSGARSANA